MVLTDEGIKDWFDFLISEDQNPVVQYIKATDWNGCGIVDIGFNCGAYSYMFQQNGGTILTAVEPVNALFDYGVKIINPIHSHLAIVGYTDTPYWLHTQWGGFINGIHPNLGLHMARANNDSNVNVVSLSNLMKQINGFDGKLVLKIDVEGMEVDVIKSANEDELSIVSEIIIEIDNDENLKSITDYLTGFEIKQKLNKHNYILGKY